MAKAQDGSQRCPCEDGELSKLLRDNTMQEVDADLLEGPFHNFGHVRQVLGCTSMTVSRLSAIALKHPNRCVQIVMKDGSILSGTLHKDIDAKQEWKGRCIDLSKVYKRVPVSLRSRPLFSAHGPPLWDWESSLLPEQ